MKYITSNRIVIGVMVICMVVILYHLLMTNDDGGVDADTNQSIEDDVINSSDMIRSIDIAIKRVDKKRSQWKMDVPAPPDVKLDDFVWYWHISTNLGDMVFHLYNSAPKHVISTIYLTRLGFYDGIVFHRVIKAFMAQSGDPTGTGTSGPNYKYDGEFPVDGPQHDKRGVLSMANAGVHTDSSQFFITFQATPHLNGRHTVFGTLVEGMHTLQKIEDAGSDGPPSSKVVMNSCTISAQKPLQRVRRP